MPYFKQNNYDSVLREQAITQELTAEHIASAIGRTLEAKANRFDINIQRTSKLKTDSLPTYSTSDVGVSAIEHARSPADGKRGSKSDYDIGCYEDFSSIDITFMYSHSDNNLFRVRLKSSTENRSDYRCWHMDIHRYQAGELYKNYVDTLQEALEFIPKYVGLVATDE